ncbi:Hypothetical predicted protein [Paramuricea clavata]|uniref:Uncharacterized protein n=1 Tax=Paramuricea clavata TaxID=317549 RepID=A0A6S7HSX3_PARCT|nr:Hypothetical predicted protein [Paramuricea clavata]
MSSSSTCTVGITTIQHEELEEISNESIGNGVFGNCFHKKFIRLGITVVEKQLTDSTADMLYKEAIFLPKLSHVCIPLLLGGATRQKANLPDNAICWGEQSVYNSVQVAI